MNKKFILTLFVCLLFVSLMVSCNKQSSSSSAASNTELTNSMGSVILRDEGAEPVIIDIEKKRL